MGEWESIKLFVGVNHIGEWFFLSCEENFNRDTPIWLLDALQTEFGEKICVVLDNASYFTVSAVREVVEVTSFESCYLPGGSLERRFTENCWKKLIKNLATAVFDTCGELLQAALAALDRINSPAICTFVCPWVWPGWTFISRERA